VVPMSAAKRTSQVVPMSAAKRANEVEAR
jgi:hypothetical protein